MPFDSPEQQDWYNASGQDYLDDEPSSARQVEEATNVCPRCDGEGIIDEIYDIGGDEYGDGPQTCPDCDGTGEIDQAVTGEDEQDWLSMGEPEEEQQFKNPIGKNAGGMTSKYDMFDPLETPDDKSYKSEPPTDVYKDYDYDLDVEEADDDYENDLFSIGDEEPQDEEKNPFGKFDKSRGGWTSKYDLFDPYEKEEQMNEATEVFYSKLIKALEYDPTGRTDFTGDPDVDTKPDLSVIDKMFKKEMEKDYNDLYDRSEDAEDEYHSAKYDEREYEEFQADIEDEIDRPSSQREW